MNCSVCGHKDFGESISVKEMMFGHNEYFSYHSCNNCRSLVLEKIPEDLGKYYPKDYYSFSANKKNTRFGSLKRNLIRLRDLSFYQVKTSFIGKLLFSVFPLTETEIQFLAYQFAYKCWLKNPDGKLLDIGSGNGNIVRYMQAVGYEGIMGMDPFIEENIYLDDKPVIFKKNIFDWDEPVDAVMMNHSFEHMLNPREVIAKINSILKPGGDLMIRVPVRGGGYDKYKEHWLCFDAPRHLFLTTEKGIRELIKDTGIELVSMRFETPYYYAIGSELIKKGYSFKSMKEAEAILTSEEIKEAERFTDQINRDDKGDAAAFYLRKK